MAHRKITIETEPRSIPTIFAGKDLVDAKNQVLTGMALARELTDQGIVFDLSRVRLRVEFDEKLLRDVITAEVEVEAERPIKSWQDMAVERREYGVLAAESSASVVATTASPGHVIDAVNVAEMELFRARGARAGAPGPRVKYSVTRGGELHGAIVTATLVV